MAAVEQDRRIPSLPESPQEEARLLQPYPAFEKWWRDVFQMVPHHTLQDGDYEFLREFYFARRLMQLGRETVEMGVFSNRVEKEDPTFFERQRHLIDFIRGRITTRY